MIEVDPEKRPIDIAPAFIGVLVLIALKIVDIVNSQASLAELSKMEI